MPPVPAAGSDGRGERLNVHEQFLLNMVLVAHAPLHVERRRVVEQLPSHFCRETKASVLAELTVRSKAGLNAEPFLLRKPQLLRVPGTKPYFT
jgi:hypothetical protein